MTFYIEIGIFQPDSWKNTKCQTKKNCPETLFIVLNALSKYKKKINVFVNYLSCSKSHLSESSEECHFITYMR